MSGGRSASSITRAISPPTRAPIREGWSGHTAGTDCVAFGNGLVGPVVLDGLIAGFLAEPAAPLEFRLMRARGRAGAMPEARALAQMHKPEQSAATKVADRLHYPDIDVRVDVHPTAVQELRRVLEEYKRYEVDPRAWPRSRARDSAGRVRGSA